MAEQPGAASITVTLSNERLARLNELAERLGISLDDLVRVSIDELLAQPAKDFERAIEYVLKTNSELYSRLVD